MGNSKAKKKQILIMLGIVIIILIVFFALMHKYDYKVIESTNLRMEDKNWGGTYIEGNYVDAVMKVKGSVTQGTLCCYYFNSETDQDFAYGDPKKLAVVERIYEAGDEIDETIKIGDLESKWQCLGIEKVGEDTLVQDVEIVLEARQYGYQIVEQFLRLKTPWPD